MNHTSRDSTARTIALYAVIIAGAVALFLLVRQLGEGLVAPVPAAPAARAAAASAGSDVLWHVMLALTAVVVVGRVLARVLGAIGQPAVIGEVIAGILLGPSLLGRAAPAVSDYILPLDVAPYLGILAQLGVVVYMFLVGLELNADMLRGHLRTTLVASHASIAVPFVMGAALALFLYPRFSSSDVPFAHFALFLGVAMSITAFPVLARILSDRGMTRTRIGGLALTCAAIGDVTAWCLLAFAVGVVQKSAPNALLVAVLTAAFIAFMFLVAGPWFDRLARSSRGERPTRRAVTQSRPSVSVSKATKPLA